MSRHRRRQAVCAAFCQAAMLWTARVNAQEPADAQIDHSQHVTTQTGNWLVMQDASLFVSFNRQGGPRGGQELIGPNWWMGMASRLTSRGRVTLTGMLSLDPATLGRDGYRELFQVGESLDGQPLVDRQHPHDLFMQLSGAWRIPLTSGTGLTIAGGPAAEPALGPVAYMHRPSAADNSFAPLSHHTFDSTHIAFGVVTAALDHGRWAVEGSVFNGREPDDDRWDVDFGALDSVSGRVWFRPDPRWELQVSTGHLTEPEPFEPGDIQRTTTSASWFDRRGDDFTAVTVGYGVNATDHGRRQAGFGEGSRRFGRNSVFGRLEVVQVETALLSGDSTIDHDRADALVSLTFGGVRDVLRVRGFQGGFGAQVFFYVVPDTLEATHGASPVSFQVFFRLNAPTLSGMGRMWNMRLTDPMAGHGMK